MDSIKNGADRGLNKPEDRSIKMIQSKNREKN